MKSTYSITVNVEIDMDPTNPASVSKAAGFMDLLCSGKLVTVPEGVDARVTASKPKIVNTRAPKAAEQPAATRDDLDPPAHLDRRAKA